MNEGAAVLSLRGTRRQRGEGDDAFTLDVPSFEIRRGECLALTGPSGCGKSTMLELLGLILQPDASEGFELAADGDAAVDVAELWRHGDRAGLAALRAERIGFVLQTGGLLPFLSAGENIALPRSLLGMTGEDELVGRVIEALGLARLLGKHPRALSVGERQRAAIARALVHRPLLLLADEPTAALDPEQGVRVMALLLELVKELDMTAAIVTHDWELVRSLDLREVRAEPVPTPRGSTTRFSC